MSITRNAGYRRSQGKEEPAILMAQMFLRAVADISTDRIEDPKENYERGDLRVSPSGATIEVKGQPIDPKRYPKNFVEVFEDTTSGQQAHHAGGLARVAEILGLDVEALQERPVVRHDRGGMRERLGTIPFVSASINSIHGSAATIYVNVQQGFLYFYGRDELLTAVGTAVRHGAFERGKGLSNSDTHAVLVQLPALRWSLAGGAWEFRGKGGVQTPVGEVRRILSV